MRLWGPQACSDWKCLGGGKCAASLGCLLHLHHFRPFERLKKLPASRLSLPGLCAEGASNDSPPGLPMAPRPSLPHQGPTSRAGLLAVARSHFHSFSPALGF